MTSLRDSFFAILSLVLFLLVSSPLRAETGAGPVDAWIELSRTRDLASDPYWRKLLHYDSRLIGGQASTNVSALFFLSQAGQIDPRAELEATLRAFAAPQDENRPDAHAQCRFPARLLWLDKKLKLGEALPRMQCPALDRFFQVVDAESVSLVFASYFMNAPASMFGHTLLKLNAPEEKRGLALLDFAINYGANPGDLDPLRYTIYGLLGGYNGNFTMLPYHMKVREYNDVEARDMWEYQLNLTREEIHRMILHVFELDQAAFPYYYLDENCSYHLLSLLEIARPSLDFAESDRVFVLPAETIKEVVRTNDLVARVIYRPSLYSEIRQRLRAMTPSERELFFDILSFDRRFDDPELVALDETRRALLLDALLSTLRYGEDKSRSGPEENQLFTDLLKLRTQIPPTVELPELGVQSEPPDDSHSVSMLRPALGGSSYGAFFELQWRPVFHDLLNSETGLAPNSEFQFSSLRLRVYDSGEAAVHRYHFLKLASLAPFESINRSISYWIDMGTESQFSNEFTRGGSFLPPGFAFREGQGALRRRDVAYIDALGGFSFAGLHETAWYSPFLVAVLAGARGQSALNGLSSDLVGGQALLMLIYNTGDIKALASARYIAYGSPARLDEIRAELGLRYKIAHNLEFRVEASAMRNFADAQAGVTWFF